MEDLVQPLLRKAWQNRCKFYMGVGTTFFKGFATLFSKAEMFSFVIV